MLQKKQLLYRYFQNPERANPPLIHAPPCPKLGKMLFSIASARFPYFGVHPRRRSFALLTRLLLEPRLRFDVDLPITGSGRFNFFASQR
jgi:hypothetical protein